MADVKWIKIMTNIFDNRKIVQIETLPDGDTIIVIWLKLLCLAGNINDSGMIYFTKEIPYTEEMLSNLFNRPLPTVRLALKVFEDFGMITVIEDIMQISNWEKYQNVDKLLELREYNRIAKQKSREKKKANDNVKVDVNDMSLTCQPCQGTDKIRLDKKEDKIREEENKTLIVSKDTIRQTDVSRVVEEWNKLQEVGISPIRGIKPSSKRFQMLKGRIREYDIETVLEAIKNVRDSDFLCGNNNNDWMITFDWFVKPNNFVKVLEGNYNKKEKQHGGMARTVKRKAKPLIPYDNWNGSGNTETPFV